MDNVDRGMIMWLNQFARTSQLLDGLLVATTESALRGAVLVALLWWAWADARCRLVNNDLFWPKFALGILLTIAIARAMQNFLPERSRPLHEATLDFQAPFFQPANRLADWSSFPSDHAAVFVGLAVAILSINALMGSLALIWVLVIGLFPRVYVGLHYPSDILGGAVLGGLVMLAVQRLPTPSGMVTRLQRLEDRHRGLAYASAFLFSFLCATLFESLRQIAQFAGRGLKLILT